MPWILLAVVVGVVISVAVAAFLLRQKPQDLAIKEPAETAQTPSPASAAKIVERVGDGAAATPTPTPTSSAEATPAAETPAATPAPAPTTGATAAASAATRGDDGRAGRRARRDARRRRRRPAKTVGEPRLGRLDVRFQRSPDSRGRSR